MKQAITKNAVMLALFAVTCTAIIGAVDLLTADRIKAQEQQQLLKTLNAVISNKSYNNNLAQQCVKFTDEHGNPQKAYLALLNDKPVAAALTFTAPDGYNGNIELIMGININRHISGVRVLKHNETPGLGDKIELRKSDWIKAFSQTQVTHETDSRWQVTKDGGMFDQFTGATITPRAVVNAVKVSALYFTTHQNQLFTSSNHCGETL